MKQILLLLSIICAAVISPSAGENILFFFGVSTYSHRVTAWPLVEALVEKGHKVTFLQAAQNKNPNPKVEDLFLGKDNPDHVIDMDFLKMRQQYGSAMLPILIHQLPWLGSMVCDEVFKDKTVVNWINTHKVDLVVIDALFNDCAYGLAHKFGAQTIVFGTSSVFEWWHDEFGFPVETNWLANLHFGQPMPLSFLGRTFATLMTLYFRMLRNFFLVPKLEATLREKLNMPDMPPLSEISANTSLVLMNTHFSEEVPRSLPPLIVPVGGMHCFDADKLPPLPKEIESFVNSAGKEGFIFVSFGSEVRINDADQELKDVFFNAFRNTKKKIIWKWGGPRPADMPSNVLTTGWVPQQTLLAQKNIKLFITHGGLLSIQEALYHKVPMITFPIFAEQEYNSLRLHERKRGMKMDILTVTQKGLEDAISTVLNDDSYRKSIEKTSRLFKDRPQKPVDTAVWWVEYVLRNKNDADVLRSPTRNHWWFQRRSLDIWAFIFAVILAVLYLDYWILRKILSAICKRSSSAPKSVPKSKKKN